MLAIVDALMTHIYYIVASFSANFQQLAIFIETVDEICVIFEDVVTFCR